ncbi:uncharacterized protein LOC134184528 isoform X2 [Corticium candelabrum]|uniref:uncharacterized protein LOC134184528 isoform X2 n=1 Tax=Corticium candelabrum TaxID=121492 RepID=UPI002E3119E3|nr:uncharacterized protein LOC134184528 isoform X2 [Corticium candelabrum]
MILINRLRGDGNSSRRKAGRDASEETWKFVKSEETVNRMFFAHQVVTNACATYALLSVLLNCPDINLGSLLGRIKEFTEAFNPESKGYAVANLHQLKIIHNKHARPVYPHLNLPRTQKRKSCASYDCTVFHYSSYVPLNGRLMELDGLKAYPVDHGPVNEGDGWISVFKKVISKRIGAQSGSQNSIQFNLLAVRPEKLTSLETKLYELQQQWKKLTREIEETLSSLSYKSISPIDHDVSVMEDDDEPDDLHYMDSFSCRLQMLLKHHHSSEFPHIFACATPSTGPALDESPKDKPLGHTQVAPLHSILYPWLDIVQAHNITILRSVNPLATGESGVLDSQLVVMPGHETAIEAAESGFRADVNCGDRRSVDYCGYDDSSSDETIIDGQSDVEQEDNATDDVSLGCDGRSLTADRQKGHGSLIGGVCSGQMKEELGEIAECEDDVVSVVGECVAAGAAGDVSLPELLGSAAQFEALRAQTNKLEQEIEHFQGLIKEEKEKHDRYNADFHRRTQDYQPFIEEFIKMLYKAELLQHEPNFDKALQQQQQAYKAATHSRRQSASFRHKQKRATNGIQCKVWSETLQKDVGRTAPSSEYEASNDNEMNVTD